jgi:hypothetical protein
MRDGDYVVVDGRLVEVMELDCTGDMLIRDALTLKLRWVDFYVARVIDPHGEDGAILEALSMIFGDELPVIKEGALTREDLEELT